jgi:hypothetical protein
MVRLALWVWASRLPLDSSNSINFSRMSCLWLVSKMPLASNIIIDLVEKAAGLPTSIGASSRLSTSQSYWLHSDTYLSSSLLFPKSSQTLTVRWLLSFWAWSFLEAVLVFSNAAFHHSWRNNMNTATQGHFSVQRLAASRSSSTLVLPSRVFTCVTTCLSTLAR